MAYKTLIKMGRERDTNTNDILNQIDNTPEVITDRIHDTIKIEEETRSRDQIVRKVRQLHGRSRQQRGTKEKKPS